MTWSSSPCRTGLPRPWWPTSRATWSSSTAGQTSGWRTPEVEQYLTVAGGAPVSLSFTPTLAPMARGILATATARVRPGVEETRLRAAWNAAYDDEPFVHLLPAGQWPRTADTLGANVV